MKVCPKCKKEKEEEEFAIIKQRGKMCIASYCKQCMKEYQEEYRRTHKRKYVYRYSKYE